MTTSNYHRFTIWTTLSKYERIYLNKSFVILSTCYACVHGLCHCIYSCMHNLQMHTLHILHKFRYHIVALRWYKRLQTNKKKNTKNVITIRRRGMSFVHDYMRDCCCCCYLCRLFKSWPFSLYHNSNRYPIQLKCEQKPFFSSSLNPSLWSRQILLTLIK